MEIMLNNIKIGPFKNLNLCIFHNKINVIIGTNGSGKSILAELIATTRKPKEGIYIIDGNKIDLNSNHVNFKQLRFDIGIVMQNLRTQFFEETVEEHIFYQLKVYNYKKSEKRIIDSLKMVGLSDSYLKRRIKTLSDTERFKVMLATVLSINPDVIVLDDSSCFLDKNETDKLVKLLKIMKIKYNKTIVITSEDTDFALKLADYIYVIDKGKIIVHGDKYDVFNNKVLNDIDIHIPEIIEFQNKFSRKTKLSLNYRDNVNDLIKDVYFNIEKRNRGKK